MDLSHYEDQYVFNSILSLKTKTSEFGIGKTSRRKIEFLITPFILKTVEKTSWVKCNRAIICLNGRSRRLII